MKRLAFLATVLSLTATAHADTGQSGSPSPLYDYDVSDLISPLAVSVEGPGVKVGEGTVLHPIVGVETGYVSNVFYEDGNSSMTQPISAGLIRILGEVSTGSLSTERLGAKSEPQTEESNGLQATVPVGQDAGAFQYRLDLYGTYDRYLSGNDNVTSQGGVGGGLQFRAVVNPEKPLSFSAFEKFDRLIRSTNFESPKDTNRDLNTFTARLLYQPTGRSLGGYLYYVNTLDLFEEDTQRFADRFQNTLGIRGLWQALPLTRVYLDVSEMISTGIGSESKKVTSFPLVVKAGIQTVLTLNVTLNTFIGYTSGFYASGPSYNTVVAGAQLGYRFSPLGRFLALYEYDHEDSINANFYRDHWFAASIEQAFVPFSVTVRPELHFREYDGVIVAGNTTDMTRDDIIFALNLGANYNLRNWLAISVDYVLTIDSTNFRYDVGGGLMDDPSYTRHQLMVGVRAAM